MPAASAIANPRKTGYLTKQGGSYKSWKHRYFVLDEKALYYYKSPKDSKPLGGIELEGSRINCTLGSKKPNCFEIVHPDRERVYQISAKTALDMQDWMEALERVVKGDKEKKPTAAKPASPATLTLTPRAARRGSGAIPANLAPPPSLTAPPSLTPRTLNAPSSLSVPDTNAPSSVGKENSTSRQDQSAEQPTNDALLKKEERQKWRRKEIMTEILETEKTYVEGLQLIFEVTLD